MNIFVSAPSPIESAKFLDDKRVIKMILESCQLLCTAINLNGGISPYKTTHKNHPCAKWARETKANYHWLMEHFLALCYEYRIRYNKTHKCELYISILSDGIELIPQGELTPFPNCTIFKDESDTFKAYKMYLTHKWNNDKRKPTWRNNGLSR